MHISIWPISFSHFLRLEIQLDYPNRFSQFGKKNRGNDLHGEDVSKIIIFP